MCYNEFNRETIKFSDINSCGICDLYFVRDISSMRYVPSGREKEFISYQWNSTLVYKWKNPLYMRISSKYVATFETVCKIKSAPTKVDARKMHNSVCCHTNSLTLGQVCENRVCIFTKMMIKIHTYPKWDIENLCDLCIIPYICIIVNNLLTYWI